MSAREAQRLRFAVIDAFDELQVEVGLWRTGYNHIAQIRPALDAFNAAVDAAEGVRRTVWVLATDSADYGTVATLHRTEADAYECLRAIFLDGQVEAGTEPIYIRSAMLHMPDVKWSITEDVLP